jgi:MYXO-CTERM domain-containing protein
MKRARALGCLSGLGVVMGLVAAVTPALAVDQPSQWAGRPALEVAAGDPVRAYRDLDWYSVPRHARVEWNALVAEMPGAHGAWDPATGVPSRIWGGSVAVPGSVSSPAVAEAFGKAFIARHIDLLAPGASVADFTLVSNDLDAGMRTLGFVQHAGGVGVIGGQLSLRFKADRLFMIGSEALPFAVADALVAPLSVAHARAKARAWMLSDSATVATAGAVDGPFVLPLVGERSVRYATVVAVTVETDPLGSWQVYLDARTGDPVARRQTLAFASGTVKYNTPVRRPGGDRFDYPALFADLDANGSVQSDVNGSVTWSGSSAVNVQTSVHGDYVNVSSQAGGAAATTLSLSPSGTVVWNESGNEYTDSQLTTFIHLNRVIEYSRGFAGDLPYLDTTVQANVNINDQCNAFYDGNGVNFFVAAGGCGNTGRLPDVVYHEFGHSLHDHGIIPGVGQFEGGASEGLSDFLAATITGDSGMGRGFFNSDEPLREIDPPGSEQVWPEDVGEVHYTGLIIAGALWDMRKDLVATLGEEAGVPVANTIFYQAMRRAVDIPTMYFEALAADDDDGDLGNGTPHLCSINAGFAPHGLRQISVQGSNVSVAPPFQDGYVLSLAIVGLDAACPSDDFAGAEVTWRLREQPEVGGTLTMALGPSGLEATIPEQPDGSVVQYQVNVDFGGGVTTTFPDNPADPFYELFIGHVEPIYCTDFETDPTTEGWTHGLSAGDPGEGADDWMWGPPAAPADSGDPRRAYSGDNAFGNDLGGGNYNGQYQAGKTNYAETPDIDTSAYQTVRLQYRRWLTVEDHQFDHATVYADGEAVWTNVESAAGNVNHTDKEWRFSDVDLSSQAADGTVKLKFELASDQGLNMGGWTLDDFCVLGYIPTVCGDGHVTGAEECDDGDANSDSEADACRTDCTAALCGDAVIDSGEACDDGNDVADDGCEADCTVTPGTPPPGENPETPPAGDDGGVSGTWACSCRTAGAPAGFDWRWMVAGLALAAARRRRR